MDDHHATCTYASDIIEQASEWIGQGRPVAVATIVHIEGSSSRPLATRMLCTDRGEFSGAVSGGCVETDLCGVAEAVFSDLTPRLVHYGSVRDPELEVGLNCEGEIDVLVEPIDESWVDRWREQFTGVVTVQCSPASEPDASNQHQSGAVSVTTPKRTWYPRDMAYGRGLVKDAWDGAAPRSTRTSGGLLMAEPVLPPPVLLIFGAGPTANDLARLSRIVGYHTIISDPRETRFPPGDSPADRTFVAWPDETLAGPGVGNTPLLPARTFIVSLEHEPRFEDALWDALLDQIRSEKLPARPLYIGAIGKAQRAIERDERARESGRDLDPLRPIHTPVGLDLGGKSSGEVAVSILAQIIATVHGRRGGRIGAPAPL